MMLYINGRHFTKKNILVIFSSRAISPSMISLSVTFYKLESCLEGFCHLLISRLTEKGEHILLVSLNSRLIKRIYSKYITADTACLLEEVEEGSEVVLIDALD